MSQTPTASPCVRNCCLNEHDVCLGCFRHLNEITAWQGLSNEAREQVVHLCVKRRHQHNLKYRDEVHVSSKHL